jgi:hypothetical protein
MARRKKPLSISARDRKEMADAMVDIKKSQTKCLSLGIHVGVECVIERQKWRIEIRFVNKDGKLVDTQKSDRQGSNSKFYYSERDYELAVLKLHHFYANR